MQRTIVVSYVIIVAVLSIYTTIQEIPPASYFIQWMAPEIGDKYNIAYVVICTFGALLLPILVLLTIFKFARTKPQEDISPDRTGLFITRPKALQSGMLGIPIYLEGKKIGEVDNGKTRFFDINPGTILLHAGKGKQTSDILEITIKEKDQLRLEVSIVPAGLGLKTVLTIR